MATEITSSNLVGLADLTTATSASNTDILIIEDVENTKKIEFSDLKQSMIDDDEFPDSSRMWSSKKISDTIDKFTDSVTKRVEATEKTVNDFDEGKVSVQDLNKALDDMDKKKTDVVTTEALTKEVENRRSSSVPITSKDIVPTSEEEKLHVEHLGKDILNAMTGNTPVTVPSVPDGGWKSEDLGDGVIISSKLSSNYRFRGIVTSGTLNSLIDDGLYLIGTDVEELPKYTADETDPKLLEVIKYGDAGKYIKQRVFYIDAQNDDETRPSFYERIGETTKLHNLTFTPHYEITSNNRVESDLLGPTYNNRGTVNKGSVYDLIENGNYLCTPEVTDLPTIKTAFLVTVQSYGDSVEYTAKTIELSGSKEYRSFIYMDSTNLPVRKPWFSTGTDLKSKFDGKHVHLFGDGIMYGLGASSVPTTSIPALLSSKYGYIVHNHALPDATYGVYGNDKYKAKCITTQIETAQQLNTADYAIIFAGSNDYADGLAEIGSTITSIETTFAGSMNNAIKVLLESNPSIKVLIASPVYRGSIKSGDGNDSDTMIANKYLSNFAASVVDTSTSNHIPCVDLFNESMINKYTKSVYLSSEGIYLNDTGHELITDKIHDAMCRFY